MQKVDLVLRNAKYLDADKREFVEGDIAIKDGQLKQEEQESFTQLEYMTHKIQITKYI